MDQGNWILFHFATSSRKTLAKPITVAAVFETALTVLQSYQVEFPFAIVACSKQAQKLYHL